MATAITLIILSLLIGWMDKIKFHYSETLLSRIFRPDWLVRWCDPSLRLFPGNWLLDGPLAGLNDLWHFLKFLMLQCIFYLAWINHMEGKWWAFFLICNLGYGVLFEMVWTSNWIKK